MISAERFLTILHEKDLVPAELIERLRRQLAQAEKAPGVEAVANELIKQGYLTPALAKRLLAAADTAEEPAAKEPISPAEDELTLAPLEDEPTIKPGATGSAGAGATGPARVSSTGAKPPAASPGQQPDVTSLLEAELKALEGGAKGTSTKGSLERLMADPTVGGAAGGMPLGPPRTKKKGWRRFLKNLKNIKGFLKRKPKKTVVVKPVDPKQVKLMVIAWGTAVLLIVGGMVLVSYLLPLSADQTLRAGQDAYEAGKFAEAVKQYASFVTRFAQDRRLSPAKVRLALAQIAAASQGSGGALAALKVAQAVVPKIEREDAFKESHKELALMLANIAAELSKQIRQYPDQALGQQARAALGLMEHYIPVSERPTEKVAEVTALLSASEQDVGRNSELDAAVTAMADAVTKGDLAQAYATCAELVKQYPDLADNERLGKAMAAVSQAQQAIVKVVPHVQAAQAAPETPGVVAAVALVVQSKSGQRADAQGHGVVALAGGAAYGLDAASGKVRWRRWVGADPAVRPTIFPPQPISTEPGSDVLLADAARQEVWRLAATSGQVVWRYAVGEPFDGPPVIAGKRVLVATRSGRLLVIDVATGNSAAYVQLPQKLHVAPAYDPQRGLVFQVAEKSNLYVLSLADGRCRQVLYLGHEAGAIAVPPVVAGDFLVVAENHGASDFTLRALAIQTAKMDPADPILKPVQPLAMKGHVSNPMAAQNRRLLVVTDQGGPSVCELDAGQRAAPLRTIAQIARSVAETARGGIENLRHYVVLQGDHFWIADIELAEYEIRAAEGRLVPTMIAQQGSLFLQPPILLGRTVLDVRRTANLPGVLVSALDVDAQELAWQTRVAVPLPSEPLPTVAEGKITALTAMGAMFRLDAAGLRGETIADQPALVIPAGKLLRPIRSVIPLSGGMFAMTSGAESSEIILFDPQEQPPRFRSLMVPSGTMACAPIALSGGLLAPCSNGQVYLLDPQSMGNMAEPFEPELKTALAWTWRVPAAVGEKDAVLSDGDKRLYRLEISTADQAKPQLIAASEAKVAKSIASPVAVAGGAAYAVDTTDTLRRFALPSLAEGKSSKLNGPCVWGPQGMGKHLLVATDKHQLLCLGDQHDVLWQVDLPYGPLVGRAWDAGDHYLFASQSGAIWRVEAATGKELGKVESGCPLGTGPVLLGERLFVGSRDGCIYEVQLP
jgi:outer membrane protein assembly factor BamB